MEKDSMKKIEVKKGFVADNFFDYAEREILPLDENCDYGKGWNFQLSVYNKFFVTIGMFKSEEDFLSDLEENSNDGSFEVELIVADNGRFFIEVSVPYDYEGSAEYTELELVGDLEELRSWVKDGLDYVNSL